MSQRYSISVRVDPAYIEEQSDPEERRFVFSYTITMENDGEVPARLLTRHWMITDADGKVEEVRGPGVVGEHPYLRPGERFQYTSGAVLQTPVGSMSGSYQMQADDGSLFDAPIPAFTLSAAVTFH